MAGPIIWRVFPKLHQRLLLAIARTEAKIVALETPEHQVWRQREGIDTTPIVLTKLAQLIPLWPEWGGGA